MIQQEGETQYYTNIYSDSLVKMAHASSNTSNVFRYMLESWANVREMYISIVLSTVRVRDQERRRGLLSVDPGEKPPRSVDSENLNTSNSQSAGNQRHSYFKSYKNRRAIRTAIRTERKRMKKEETKDSSVGTSETTRENPQTETTRRFNQ